MSIRDRITQLKQYLTKQIRFATGDSLLGRAGDPGAGQEIKIGTGLTLSGNTLSVTVQEASWDTLVGKPSTFPPSLHTHTFDAITGKPYTLSGYGITDAMPKVILRSATAGLPTLSEYFTFLDPFNEERDGQYAYLGTIESGIPVWAALNGTVTIINNALAGSGNVFIKRDMGSGPKWALESNNDWANTSPSSLLQQWDDVTSPNPLYVSLWFDTIADATRDDLVFSTIQTPEIPVVGQEYRVGDESPYAWSKYDGSTFIPIDEPPLTTLDLSNISQSSATIGQIPTWNGSEWVAASPAITSGDISTTGGANKIPQLDGNGTLRLGPVNSTDSQPSQTFRIPAFQRTYYESKLGTVAAEHYLIANHSATLGNDIGFGAGVFPELFFGAPRHCFYWDEGFQIGNANNNREYGRYLYFRALGNATSPDPVRQSVPTFWNGQNWNGGSTVSSNMGLQWVPGTTSTSGEFVFVITPSFSAGGTANALTNGVLTSVAGAVLPFSVTQAGPKVGVGKVLTFGDGTTMDTAPQPYQARTGNATLVGGTVTVADDTVTAYTNIMLTRRSAGGTIGDLTYSVSNGTGFTITSASATDTSRVTYHLVESLVAATAPTISGTNAVSDVLTVVSGGGGGGYQWYSNGVAVSGETGSTYTIRHQDIGLDITCTEGGVESNAITAWHPNDESGYFADFRADTGVLTAGGGAATHGQVIETWQDVSGNARHVTQATSGYRPTFDSTTYAGYPHMRGDGVDDHLSRAVTLTRPQTVFIVCEVVNFGINKRVFSTGSSGSRMLIQPDFGGTGLVKNGGATTPSSSWAVDSRAIITGRTTSTQNHIRLNAGTEYSATETTGNGAELLIGGSSAANSCDSRIFAVLFYAADLDTSAQARVRAYLKAKWNTP